MTRTNAQFEFINWRLTAFWLAGGFIRYFLLFPARLTILMIGVRFTISRIIFLNKLFFIDDIDVNLMYWT